MIDQATVDTGFILLGIIGGTIYLCMSIFYIRIVQHLQHNRKTAITKFFLKEDTVKAFKILALSGLGLVIAFSMEIYGVTVGDQLIATVARAIYPLPMIGLTYFSYTLQKVTQEN